MTKYSNMKEIQARLIALGYDVGPSGADGKFGINTENAVRRFQKDKGLIVDGDPGSKTQAALFGTATSVNTLTLVPPDWMPAANMKGIVAHWTAGAHKASALDKAHYHILIEADGTLVRGTPSIALNSLPSVKPGYAAHTRGCNSGFIGVSLCCMADAKESPFVAGNAPMTRTQWDRLPHVLAALCDRYGIKVTPSTVLSHAEVQPTLGIKQAGKWDISRLAFDPNIVGARKIGDLFRAKTLELLK